MVNKKNKKPIITEAWTGPGRKDEKITVFKPEFDAIHIDMKQRGNSEWWYFDARLDNGYTVVAFFRAKHERRKFKMYMNINVLILKHLMS
ncbi:MAG: hypothetical protein ACTSR5_15325 [Promethearchaeota archaeon]